MSLSAQASKILTASLVFLLLLPVSYAQSTSQCLDPSTLERNISLTTNDNSTSIREVSACPWGCNGPIGGAKCSNNPGLVPMEIYIFLGALAFLFFIMSFFKLGKDDFGKEQTIIIFPWIAFILMVVLALASTNILVGEDHFQSTGLLWLWAGMAIITLVISIFMTLTVPWKESKRI
jgi:hypothetical protein